MGGWVNEIDRFEHGLVDILHRTKQKLLLSTNLFNGTSGRQLS